MQNSIHTPEELAMYNKAHNKAIDLEKLAKRYDDETMLIYSANVEKVVQEELAKYNKYIGTKALRPKDNFLYKADRPGQIESISHFLHNDIVVKFRYDSNGFDTIRLSELI